MRLKALRDGTTTQDRRLDRLVEFDEKSRMFPIVRTLGSKRPRSRIWTCKTRLDQGPDGACVGFGMTHELLSQPAPVPGLNAKFAKEEVYWIAQREDEFPGGAYPGAKPFGEGTSLLAGLKVLKRLGYCDEYRWSFRIEELILGVGHNGPAVIGVMWRQSMMDPDPTGLVTVSGRIVGGHCVMILGVDVKRELFLVLNSWGEGWAASGTCWISFADMEILLKGDGEAAFLIGRHTKPRPVKIQTKRGRR